MKFKTTAIFLSIAMLGGCTKALVATYEPGQTLNNNNISGKKLAIYQFEDTRAWIDSDDAKSKGFIAMQDTWKFGLKYKGKEFQPVSAILQDVFIDEFKSVGMDAFKGEGVLSPTYSLKGKILNFEFANETGFVTITSRRQVSLALTLSDPSGKPLLANELFNEISRENEGMGVMHSTNVDKLMKEVLKKVVVNVVSRTNSELSYLGFKAVKVSLNGADITPFVDSKILASLSSSY